MAAVAFPSIRPSGRNYTPGAYPQAEFQALNGATTTLRYGNRRFNAELQLNFENISDDKVVEILQHYEKVGPSEDWVSFSATNASGASSDLGAYFRETGGSGLHWRYAEPPIVQSVFLGTSTVSCTFVAQLDAA